MATFFTDSRGCGRVQFRTADGQRKTLTIGRSSEASLSTICQHVSAILESFIVSVEPPVATRRWVADSLTTPLGKKLLDAGLVHRDDWAEANAQPNAGPVLGAFLQSYLAKRDDLKPASRVSIENAARNLIAFFGESKPLGAITPADADDFGRWLGTKARSSKHVPSKPGLASATKGKRLQICVTLFRDAVRRKLIEENPFSDIKKPAVANAERQRYIPAASVEQLIEATNDTSWKCLLSMARYQGLRTPTEPFSLRWADIDWERQRMTVTSVKTAHHEGKGSRVMPILPQTMPHLQGMWDLSKDGDVYVFERLRERYKVTDENWGRVNLRTQLDRLMKFAGVEPWPRLWHNLRASAQTDMADLLPGHAVCQMFGNSQAVAARHYLQVTEEHYAAAIGGQKKALSNALQLPTETGRNTAQLAAHRTTGNEKTPVFQGFIGSGLGDTGFEPVTSTV